MSKLYSLLPETREVTTQAVIDAVNTVRRAALPPRSEEARKFCADLSQSLLADDVARQYPELQALAFWLRPASVNLMVERYLNSLENTQRVAAGVVFQLPPANVVTLFGYTSAIALLCGDVALVRLPSAPHPVQLLLISLMAKCLQQAGPALAQRLVLLRYNHDDIITAELSRICDVRLIWGSDETVDHIRQLPLPPLARHVSFGDRFSAAALGAEAYKALSEGQRSDLIKKIYNDIYLFDQLACSSPRLLLWVGKAQDIKIAEEDFYPRLATHAASRGYEVGVGESILKQNASYLALHDLKPRNYQRYRQQLSVITLPDLTLLAAFKSINYGYGMLLVAHLGSLDLLATHAERRDQTLMHWGIQVADIRRFIEVCQGRGFDRIVPAGQALSFDPIWDGYNLFDLMSRFIEYKV